MDKSLETDKKLDFPAIQMVDLKNQYLTIKNEIDSAIQNVIDDGVFINGKIVRDFASEFSNYLDGAEVIPCGNGTDALQIALMALDLPKGSKVICPAFNYVATAETISILDLVPQFIDVDSDTFCIDTAKIESLIDEKTKAIMPVHLFGQSCNMSEIKRIAEKYDLFVIEDNAQSIGSEISNLGLAGTIGDLGTTSFFPSKNLGCFGDGGAIFTKNTELAERCKMIASHGQKQKYQFDIIGMNSRLDSMQAAVLKVKLNYLNDYIKSRQKLARYYDHELGSISDLKVPSRSEFSTHVFHQYTLKLNDAVIRENLRSHLKSHGIPTMVYYPKSLHLHNAYSYLGYNKGDFPVSEELCEKVLSLPMHTEMREDQAFYIVEKVKEYFT